MCFGNTAATGVPDSARCRCFAGDDFSVCTGRGKCEGDVCACEAGFSGEHCEQCLNDENPHSGTSNCNPLPCSFDYHYDHAVTPTAVRLALHDDPNRFPSAVTVSYYDSTAAQWTLCKHRTPLLGFHAV